MLWSNQQTDCNQQTNQPTDQSTNLRIIMAIQGDGGCSIVSIPEETRLDVDTEKLTPGLEGSSDGGSGGRCGYDQSWSWWRFQGLSPGKRPAFHIQQRPHRSNGAIPGIGIGRYVHTKGSHTMQKAHQQMEDLPHSQSQRTFSPARGSS